MGRSIFERGIAQHGAFAIPADKADDVADAIGSIGIGFFTEAKESDLLEEYDKGKAACVKRGHVPPPFVSAPGQRKTSFLYGWLAEYNDYHGVACVDFYSARRHAERESAKKYR